MPNGTGDSCGGCKTARLNYERWEKRERERGFADLLNWRAEAEHLAATVPSQPNWTCRDCHDSGVVLMSDGKPSSEPSICHHGYEPGRGKWHRADDAERARYASVIAHHNTGTWDELTPEKRTELLANAEEAA